MESNPRLLIQNELARRIERNPRYSMRAFAKASGISHTVLSLVMSGKRPLSRQAAIRLARFLELDPRAEQALLARRRQTEISGVDYSELSLDRFALLADWYHLAILSLLELPRAQLEPKWISRMLGISIIEAKIATERLQRLELIEKGPDGHWRQSGKPIRFNNSDSTAASRKYQRQLLERATHSLENDAPEMRDLSAMTLAIDPALVPYARERIREFRRELAAELERKGAPQAVYALSVQIFPLSRTLSNQENLQ